MKAFAFGACALALATTVSASQVKVPFVQSKGGRLTYAEDSRGDRVPDFSAAGYAGGGVPLPDVPVRVRVLPQPGEAGPRIQAAIDYVSSLPADTHGFRGAIWLGPGRYEIAGQLKISTGGVVLRGAGAGDSDTVLVATGTDRRTLITVDGRHDPVATGAARAVVDAYVPVGAISFRLTGVDGLHVGDRVLVERPSTKEWIAAIGMSDAPAREPFAWVPGKFDSRWERTIVSIRGDAVTVDAPLTTALDRTFGGGTVTAFSWPGRLTQVGVEDLRCESAFDPANPKDEQHAWMAIGFDAVENGWVANVTAVHFASSAVQLGAGCRAVTVEDCASLAPVSEIGGYRRHSFHTDGQQTLFLRCRAEDGIHDFTVGYMTVGPNVFAECRADRALGWSGSIGSWASGVLFDNVHIDGAGLNLENCETWNQGVGWAAANSVLWQCSASVMRIQRPPTAQNWATGVWAEFLGDGWWDQVNEFVRPQSLYEAQLAARIGPGVLAALAPRSPRPPSGGIPTVEQAVPELSARLAPRPKPPGHPLSLANGWLVADGRLLIGKSAPELQWWRGVVIPTLAAGYGPAITRFVPGEIGPGLTDDLTAEADAMVKAHEIVVRHHYGLWYDRRRMDHERVRRATPDDWPPFFEQPFLRSGQGEAWDRMSRYDLTRYNPWYFGRLRDFAELSREKGLVLIDEMYFQHNILEAGAHWVDCPWRPANCLQPTGFPEPPPFTDNDGNKPPTPDLGKRIFMAAEFYDVSNPVRRALHRAFIRQCLANQAEQPNVIHTLTAENSGPLSFMQFWLDVVAEWERETGLHPLIALSAPKDVQDAILSDPARAAVVDVIDLTYWWRTEKGKLYAPRGGTDTTPRQYEREWHGGRASAASLADMAREYRARFPRKAIITGLEQGDGWEFVAAGGSLGKLPAGTDKTLLVALSEMRPVGKPVDHVWALGDGNRQYFICNSTGGEVSLHLPQMNGRFEIRSIDPKSGIVSGAPTAVMLEPGEPVELAGAHGRPALWWLVKRE